jgi:PTH1 family peptidyl-tRNA hydrolase
MLADRLAARLGCSWRSEKKFFAELAEGSVGGRNLVLCKPQTFMNASGEAVGAVAGFHRVEPLDVLVVVDDADLPLGAVRLRPDGSHGGHRGLASVEQHLGTRGYPRLRLGVARPHQAVRDIAGHVLGRFTAEEQTIWNQVLDRAESQAICWLTDGLAKAMNLYNGSVV